MGAHRPCFGEFCASRLLLMEALARDVAALRTAFLAGPAHAFADFARVWRELRFSLLHCAMPTRPMQTAVRCKPRKNAKMRENG